MSHQFQQTPKNKNLVCLTILRDSIWQFVFGFLGCLISVIGIVVALPQAAHIRTGVIQSIQTVKPLGQAPPATTTELVASGTKMFNTPLSCGNCHRKELLTRGVTFPMNKRRSSSSPQKRWNNSFAR